MTRLTSVAPELDQPQDLMVDGELVSDAVALQIAIRPQAVQLLCTGTHA